MPVPAKLAKCCLTEEAARAMDEAVEVARSRNNAQTNSLHAVFALLASSSSMLREACVQTRRSAYSVRLQVRALELLVGMSLDRLPSSKSDRGDVEPPVSNSLMAVIKRAQAAQRRNPDNFQLRQIHSFHQPPSLVKVEVKHFTLSILDDPVVSRVFEEAGFRSLDVKLCILSPERYPIAQPLPPILLSERRRIVEAFKNEDIDENSRVLGDLLVKKNHGKTCRNPLLLGVCSITALAGFIGIVSKKRSGVVPEELSGLKVVSLDIPIFIYTCHGGSEEQLEEKFKEVESTVDQYCLSEPGVVVNFGELRAFVDFRVSVQATNFVVSKLSRLFKIKKGNFWLMGTCLYYETYLKFQEMFPTLEQDWDLHLLPVSSKSSFMKSFVPITGFFSWSNARNQQHPPSSTCYLCTEKYDQELRDLLNHQPSTSAAAGELWENLPSWLRMGELEKSKGDGPEMVDDDGTVRLSANVLKLKKKWMDICNCQHQCNSFTESEISQMKRAFASPHIIIVQHSTKESSSNNRADPISFKIQCATHHIEDVRPSCPSHTNDVTTNLALGTIYESAAAVQDTADLPKSNDNQEDHLRNTSGSAESSTPDVKDFKALRRVFAEKVSYQDDAICTISEAVLRCRNGSKSRGDIWLNFLGSDKIGKKKIASALAEIMFGNKENVISMDFSSRDRFCHSNSIFGCQESNDFSLKFHKRNDACYVAWELRKKPCSIIFLENVDKADNLLKSSLSQAIKTGKFPNPDRGDISIANMIFVTTFTSTGGDSNAVSVSKRKPARFSEEIILGARSWQMQILVSELPNLEHLKKRRLIQGSDSPTTESPKRGHKSLRRCLDLNLPTGEADAGEDLNSEDHYNTDIQKEIADWSEDFCAHVDETVVFKPFNFDAVAEKVMKEIELQFRRTFGSGVILEVDYEVIVQVLAAAWISGRNEAIEDWVAKVLSRSFSDVQEKYHPTARSVVKLAVCEEPLVEEYVPGLCLPGQVIV
ncbi:hypothetical protein Ddye_022725 [Dipteronia dyeriana]|uniref:Clp R domain-containing protein n=1 Tax=Dipteronia dyeriana TaxID=168575 RepID=A0AAD9TS31_9ROSI|nr:hypothetical protein Ddye_022725 [Dipteronia dyeriana]